MVRRLMAVLLTAVAILAAGWLALRRPDIPFHTLEAAYASPESEYIVLGSDGARVHFRDQGRVDGPAIVLVHGFSSSLHSWTPWIRGLEDTYRVISLDLPGHGLTRGFDTELVNMAGFVDVIDQVTDEIGVERFVLVGSSMGGNAAWNFALEHPERLDGLVLVGASGWPPTEAELADRPLVLRLLANPAARRLLKDLDMSALIRSGLEDSFVDPRFVTDEMVERYASLSRAPGHRAALLHILSDADEDAYASRQALGAIDVPTLVMQGREDALVPVRFAEAFAEAIPGADLVIYDAVGHLPHEEIAQRSLADLEVFLQRLTAASVSTLGPGRLTAATESGADPGP